MKLPQSKPFRWKIALLCFMCSPVLAQPAAKNWSEAVQLGSIYFQSGKTKEAREHFQSALKFAKTEEEKILVFDNLALVDIAEEKFEAAREKLDQVIAAPTTTFFDKQQAQLTKARTFQSQQQAENARKEFAKVLEILPLSPSIELLVHLEMIRSYRTENRFDEARKAVLRIFQMRYATAGTLAIGYLEQGQIYADENRMTEARFQFSKIGTLQNESLNNQEIADFRSTQIYAQARIAQTYFTEKNFPLARTEYQKLLAMEKLDPQLRAQATEQLKQIDAMEKK